MIRILTVKDCKNNKVKLANWLTVSSHTTYAGKTVKDLMGHFICHLIIQNHKLTIPEFPVWHLTFYGFPFKWLFFFLVFCYQWCTFFVTIHLMLLN